MFTYDELKELKYCINTMIGVRVTYLYSNISEEEKSYTQLKLKEDYKLLEKVLELIFKEETNA